MDVKTKTKTVGELQTRIDDLKENVETKKTYLEQYRNKRAALVVNEVATAKNEQSIANIDTQIKKIQQAIDNAPAELELLEENLAAENQRIAAAERDKLLKAQHKVAKDIENLSKQFIDALKVAKDLNELLRNALSVYSGIQQKTGQNVLSSQHAQGSVNSLRMLLEKSEAEFAGQHIAVTGPGIVPTNARIIL